MNYEEKYNEALERARKIHNYTEFDYEKGMMEEVFPELAESEDERIRKALIRFHRSTIDVDGIKGEDIIAWLEKQGEQEKPQVYKTKDGEMITYSENDGYKIVGPKFHEGEWITIKE